jgi:hypothetical protein
MRTFFEKKRKSKKDSGGSQWGGEERERVGRAGFRFSFFQGKELSINLSQHCR